MSNQDTVLQELNKRLRELYGDRLVKLVLFGSRARGDNDPDSDYDVLVVLKGHVNPFNESRFAIDTTAEIGLKHAVAISCIYASDRRFEDDRGLLFNNIRTQGRSL